MKIEQHPVHAISWVDLAARDFEAQVDFYTDMMGWSTFMAPGTGYTMFLVGDKPVAGIVPIRAESGAMPSVWSTYVNVDDADATCARAKEIGGSVFQGPFEIPNGRIAVIGDPASAAICVFEGGGGQGFKLYDEPGAPCWFEVMSHDAKASIAFYEALFGWRSEPMPGPIDYTILNLGDTPVGGCMQIGDPMPADIPSHWQVSFSIDGEISDFMAKASDKGATVMMGPMETDYGHGAVLMDPAGASFVAFDRSKGTM
ncbi:MAG: VOC family protein [Acidimicrobiia bacterium]|nr:VOC family protein [Acidimicrobiia bacterium]